MYSLLKVDGTDKHLRMNKGGTSMKQMFVYLTILVLMTTLTPQNE